MQLCMPCADGASREDISRSNFTVVCAVSLYQKRKNSAMPWTGGVSREVAAERAVSKEDGGS